MRSLFVLVSLVLFGAVAYANAVENLENQEQLLAVRSKNQVRYDCNNCDGYACRAYCATRRAVGTATDYVADRAQDVVDGAREAKRVVTDAVSDAVDFLWHDEPPMKSESQLSSELGACNIGSRCTTTAACETMIRCIRDVFTRARDNRAVFPTAYNVVTQEINSDIGRGVYQDTRWLSELLMEFANMYRAALHQYMRAPGATTMDLPTCWRNAFDSARGKRNPFVADLCLAMNAHIDHDLAIAVVRVGYSPSHRQDFFTVERALSRSTNDILRDLSRYDSIGGRSSIRGLQWLISMGGRFAQWVTDSLMRLARTNVWENAGRLAAAGGNCGRIGGPSCPALQHIKDVSATISRAGSGALSALPNPILNGVRTLERADFSAAIGRIN